MSEDDIRAMATLTTGDGCTNITEEDARMVAFQCQRRPGAYIKCSNSCKAASDLHENLDMEWPVYAVVFPMLVILAVIANIFVVLVLSRRRMVINK